MFNIINISFLTSDPVDQRFPQQQACLFWVAKNIAALGIFFKKSPSQLYMIDEIRGCIAQCYWARENGINATLLVWCWYLWVLFFILLNNDIMIIYIVSIIWYINKFFVFICSFCFKLLVFVFNWFLFLKGCPYPRPIFLMRNPL